MNKILLEKGYIKSFAFKVMEQNIFVIKISSDVKFKIMIMLICLLKEGEEKLFKNGNVVYIDKKEFLSPFYGIIKNASNNTHIGNMLDAISINFIEDIANILFEVD